MKINAYLYFPGTCEAALRFYERTLGAKTLKLFTYKGSPMEADVPSEMAAKVMHAAFEVAGQTVMASDLMPPHPQAAMSGFALSINVDTVPEADRVFAALADGGKVTMPIEETFWARRFGMLIDKFGTPWMVNCEKPM